MFRSRLDRITRRGSGGLGSRFKPSFRGAFRSTGSIIPQTNGIAVTTTFTRASTATITDQDLIVRYCLSGEARMVGQRRVFNLLRNTEDATTAAWLTLAGLTKSNVAGGILQFAYDGSGIAGQTLAQQNCLVGAVGTFYRGAADIRLVSGSATVRLNKNIGTTATVAISTDWQRFDFGGVTQGDGGSAIVVNISLPAGVNTATTIQVRRPLLEEVTGQSNQNPAEYVSRDTLSSPFHGANVDGVRYFPTLNGNTVTANVVTEATGALINGNANFGQLPGVAGNYFSTPDSVAASITGDIDIRVNCALVDWTPATIVVLVGKFTSPGNQRAYNFYVATDGTLTANFIADGLTNNIAVSSVATGIADGAVGWVRVARISSTGSTIFYTSQDGVTWTQLGTTQSTTVGGQFNGTGPLEIGSQDGGTLPINGKIYRAQIYNGINGTLAVDFNPNSYTTGTTWTSATSEVWTINGSASVAVVRNRGYLPEAAATNLCLQSADFSTTWAVNNSAVSVNQTTAPDGTLSADKIDELASLNAHWVQQTIVKAASAITYTYSVYCKQAERTWVQLVLYDGVSVGTRAWFNLGTGVVGSTQAIGAGFTGVSVKIEAAANGFYRCTLVATSNTVVALQMNVNIATADLVDLYTGTASSGIFAWGAQLVTGDQSGGVNSYIPTTTVAVTRAADLLFYSTTGWLNASAGTLYAEWLSPSVVPSAVTVTALNDATANNLASLYLGSVTVAGFAVTTGGVNQANLTNTAITGGASAKSVGVYQANDFDAFANNIRLGTGDLIGTIPTVTRLEVGSSAGGTHLGNPIAEVVYYPVRAPSTYAQRLTA